MAKRILPYGCVAALCALLLACEPAPVEVTPEPTPIEVIRNLSFAAHIDTTGSSYRGVVNITNPLPFPVKFGLHTFGCAVLLRLHSPDGSVVWDQVSNGPRLPLGCKSMPSSITLERGQAIDVKSDVVPFDFVENTLTTGTYAGTVTLRFGRMVPLDDRAFTSKTDSVLTLPAGEVVVRN